MNFVHWLGGNLLNIRDAGDRPSEDDGDAGDEDAPSSADIEAIPVNPVDDRKGNGVFILPQNGE